MEDGSSVFGFWFDFRRQEKLTVRFYTFLKRCVFSFATRSLIVIWEKRNGFVFVG
jgi:hypothetical protein